MLDRFRRMEPFELAAQPDFPARMRHCMIADGRPLSGPGSLFFQIDLIGTFVAREPHRENDGNMPSAASTSAGALSEAQFQCAVIFLRR